MHTLWPYFVFKYTPNLFRQSVNKSIWQVDGTAGTNIDIRMFTERNETENRHVFWNLRLFIVYIYISQHNRYMWRTDIITNSNVFIHTPKTTIAPFFVPVFTCRNPSLLEACRPWWASQISRQRPPGSWKGFDRFEAAKGWICFLFLLKFLRDALLFYVDWFKATGSNCVLMHRC